MAGIFTTILQLYCCLNAFTESARILGYFGFPSYSHQICFQPIWRELSLRGHNVTVLTTHPLRDPNLVNLTEIELKSSRNLVGSIVYSFNWTFSISDMNRMLYETMSKLFRYQMRLPDVEQFLRLNNGTEYDVAIIETYLPMNLALGAYFKAPLVAIASLDVLPHIHWAVGNTDHPLLNPYVQVRHAAGTMGLYERLHTFSYWLWYQYWYYTKVLPDVDRTIRTVLKTNVGSIAEIERNVSLVLINVDPILHGIRANIPAVIPLGRLHIGPVQALPQDVMEYLNAPPSKEGVIVVSMGSNVRSADMSVKHVVRPLYDALVTVPYKVIWKWENDQFPFDKRNIKPMQWLPQRDLLVHKDVKVFISQGGIQSVEEALVSGVPIIGIPLFADQPKNMERLEIWGSAIMLDPHQLTAVKVISAILQITTNPKYRERALALQRIILDEPQTPLERAIWWIEYVIRHKGAPHLKRQYPELVPWWQFYFLDCISVIIFILIVFGYLLDLCVTALVLYIIHRQRGTIRQRKKSIWLFCQPFYLTRWCCYIVHKYVKNLVWKVFVLMMRYFRQIFTYFLVPFILVFIAVVLMEPLSLL